MTTSEQARDKLRELTAEMDAYLWWINSIVNSQTDNLQELQAAQFLRAEVERVQNEIALIRRML